MLINSQDEQRLLVVYICFLHTSLCIHYHTRDFALQIKYCMLFNSLNFRTNMCLFLYLQKSGGHFTCTCLRTHRKRIYSFLTLVISKLYIKQLRRKVVVCCRLLVNLIHATVYPHMLQMSFYVYSYISQEVLCKCCIK